MNRKHLYLGIYFLDLPLRNLSYFYHKVLSQFQVLSEYLIIISTYPRILSEIIEKRCSYHSGRLPLCYLNYYLHAI